MLRLATAHLEQINAQAQAAYPGECCGLLAGRIQADGSITVTRVTPSANVADPPGDDRFEVDPKVRFDLMRALADTDETIVGHYHSHPDQPGEPSQTDLAMAFEPELVWLITPVAAGVAGRTRAWRLDRDKGTVEGVALKISQTA